MNRPSSKQPLATFIGAAVTTLTAAALFAAEPQQKISLFNGHNLDGWVNVNGDDGTWQVRDGAIICSGEPRCFLRTDKMYENYVLSVQWRHAAPGGNSGIFVHADALPQIGAPYPRSVEAQLHDGDHGSLFGIRGGSIAPLTRPDKKGRTARARPLENRCLEAGQWNTYSLKSQAGNLELSVNGKVVTRAKDASLVKGYICLQAEHSEIHFRNIVVQPLPSSNPSADKIAQADEGFASLFDGVSFDRWKHLPGHRGHWVANDGQIEYDGQSEEKKRTDKDLWTQREYGDFVLVVDWRLPVKPTIKQHPVVLPNGDFVYDDQGKRKTFPHLDAGDSGLYLRGNSKSQLNIWSQELGSGEINGYRTDRKLPGAIRLACIPTTKADRPFGQWNRFRVTVRGEEVSVSLNGQSVIDRARLPGMPQRGPIGLQHHNDPVHFRNLLIKEMD